MNLTYKMINKAKKILTEISAAELLDKISILEIKLDNINNKESLIEDKKEYKSLNRTKNSKLKITQELRKLITELKKINIKLWNIEDKKRICEKNKDFRQAFVDLSRSVYLNNDKRANIKSEINKILGSNIREIKKYVNY